MNQVAHPNGEAHAHGIGHVSPLWQLVLVLLALLILTIVTVAVTLVDLGDLNIWIALAIAVVKGALVGLYFMHLRYDSPFNGMILILALLFVGLFIGLTLIDTGQYAPKVRSTPSMAEQPVTSP